MAAGILSTLEVREYIQDYPDENKLLDKEEFSDTYIQLCMDMAVEEYNSYSPISLYNSNTFPSKGLLLVGTLAKMYLGRAATLARNHMSYSDGGLTIPIEERYELYMSLANQYGAQFSETAKRLKISQNMADGWGEVRSDESNFPLW